ncbi:tetratricopeptide repeat protein [Treponema putidum]|uniref:tetratricopeptide repeat protein n=1 Tax=Treponema putidum TaxID=221027 RepID=UPI003D8D5220
MRKNIFIIILGILLFASFTQLFAKGSIEEDLAGEYFSIAQGYAEIKNYPKAADYYLKAAKSEKYKNAAQYNLAQVYSLQNDWENCLKYIEPLYKKAPENIKLSTAYAYALASSGKEEKALLIYEKIYLEDKETPEYFFNYVRILIIVKKYEKAKELLNESKEKFTQDDDKKTISELEKEIEKLLNPPELKSEIKKDETKTD